jgi:hypothetical protein
VLTGKDAFDAIADFAAPYLGQSQVIKGVNYTLYECLSVTGPYSTLCEVEGFWANREVVKDGVDALVVRYATTGQGRKVDPLADVRVLTEVFVPLSDPPTNQEMKANLDAFLEAGAR